MLKAFASHVVFTYECFSSNLGLLHRNTPLKAQKILLLYTLYRSLVLFVFSAVYGHCVFVLAEFG